MNLLTTRLANSKYTEVHMNINTTNQNEKIELLTDEWLLIGIDVGSEKHFARAFSNRKVEYSKKAFEFNNSKEGFEAFGKWIESMKTMANKKYVMAGMEPTGHYWLNLAKFIKKSGMILSHVNPAHVKKAKELDDTNPSKSDRKDPKTIAGLMADGRYVFPYIPEETYADIRDLNNLLDLSKEQLIRTENRFARWLSIYFPEYSKLYSDTKAISGLLILKKAPLPEDIIKLGVEGINDIWRQAKLRGVGKKKAQKIHEAAVNSIGRKDSCKAARFEMAQLLDDLELYTKRVKQLEIELQNILSAVPNVDKLTAIKGIGFGCARGFIAETGDISRFSDAKDIQKLSGLAIVENSSGKHQGKYMISYRGRKKLRKTMYLAAVSVIAHNDYFKVLYEHFLTRNKNPLKKMQAIIAVACKLIRIFHAILTKGVDFDGKKMLADIRRSEIPAAA